MDQVTIGIACKGISRQRMTNVMRARVCPCATGQVSIALTIDEPCPDVHFNPSPARVTIELKCHEMVFGSILVGLHSRNGLLISNSSSSLRLARLGIWWEYVWVRQSVVSECEIILCARKNPHARRDHFVGSDRVLITRSKTKLRDAASVNVPGKN
jgi:hypothetical protein